jgi:hypothetical protein
MNRLKTDDIRNWLKGLLGDTFNTYYINKVNKNKRPNTNKLGVYYTKNSLPHIYECLGGYEDHRTDYFTLLIIGNDNYEESRELGEKVFETLLTNSFMTLTINDIVINQIELITQLEDVSDYETEGLYEFVINLKINYNY